MSEHNRCCDDRLNPPNTYPSSTPSAWLKLVLNLLSAASEIPMTTLSPKPSTAVASSLPIFVSDDPSTRIPISYNGLLLDVPSSQAPLYGLALVVLYAIALAGNTIKALYGARIAFAEFVTDAMWFFPTPVKTAGEITLAAVSSYALTIWSYGLAYYFLLHRLDCYLFNAPANDTVFTWLYFSLVTMATVGFGEVTPQTDWARAPVSSEIILGVAYQIFLFSIVASFVRERTRR